MKPTVLLTGTRAPATLDLARRLWREGCRVIGVDSLRFPLGRFSRAFAAHHRTPSPRFDRDRYIEALADIIRRERVDFLWPTCEEVFHIAKAHDPLSQAVTLLCPSFATLDLLHHKLHFAQWVQSLGQAVTAPESWDAALAPRDARLVWKPCYSRFASRTRFDEPPDDTAGWMAQRFVGGREFCSWALCMQGDVRVMTQYRSLARAGRGAGCAFEPAWSAAAHAFTLAVARRLDITGSLAFDFIESADDARTYVIECNPRLTSGIHVLSPEVRLSEVLTGAAIASPPPQRPAQLRLPTLFSAPRLAGASPDVVHQKDDPRPAWMQPLVVAEFLGRAVRRRVSLLEATTWDIEFNGT